MLNGEWLDEEPTQEEMNDGPPVEETVDDYDGWVEDEFPPVAAPVEPAEGQNAGEEVAR